MLGRAAVAMNKRVPSDEADKAQLKMALAEGEAYQKSLAYMVGEVADTGAKKQVGDYIVAIAQERAEGMYMPGDGGELVWKRPTDENCHLEVSVSDAADKRFIPALEIHATLIPETGEAVGPVKVPFLWHPGLYHYGLNLKVPGNGRYKVRIHIAAPTFGRHDAANGKRFEKDVDVEFEDVNVETGQE